MYRARLSTVQLTCVLACIGFAASATAQVQPKPIPRPHDISGYVKIANRPAPAGVLVRLRSDDAGVPVDQVSSDSTGRFEFRNLLPAIYIVSAEYSNCRKVSEQVDLRYSPSASVQLRLIPLEEPSAVPPGGPADVISAKVPKTAEGQKALAQGQTFLFEKNDAKKSIEPFKKVVRVEPDYAPGYVLLGTAYVALGDWAQAESAFRSATNLDSSNGPAWVGMGAVLNQTGRYAAAEEVLRKGSSFTGTIAEGQYELGRSLWAQGRWQESEEYVRKALALNRNYVLAHVLLGNILLRKQDSAGATTEFNEALRLQPEGPAADQVRNVVRKLEAAKR